MPGSVYQWKWFVCFGACVVYFVISGLMNSGGVVMSELMDKFHTQRGPTAWVSSMAASGMYFFAPLSTAVCHRYGCRAGVTSGLIICCVGLVGSAFAPSLTVLYVTYGVLWGVGSSLTYFPALIALSQYFPISEHAFANGIAMSGAAAGTLTLSPMIEELSATLGISYAFLILLALHVFLLIPLAAFRPVPKPALATVESETKAITWSAGSLSKNPRFIVWVVALFVFILAYLVPYVHLVRMAEDMGVSKTEAALLISYMSIASFAGRIILGKISDMSCCGRLLMIQLAILIIGFSTILVAFAPSYPWLVCYAIVFGIFDGCYLTLNCVVTREIVGPQNLAMALGIQYFVMSFPRTLGPPIAGWIFDASSSYTTAFISMGGTTVFSALLMSLIRIIGVCSGVKNAPSSSSSLTSLGKEEVIVNDCNDFHINEMSKDMAVSVECDGNFTENKYPIDDFLETIVQDFSTEMSTKEINAKEIGSNCKVIDGENENLAFDEQ